MEERSRGQGRKRLAKEGEESGWYNPLLNCNLNAVNSHHSMIFWRKISCLLVILRISNHESCLRICYILGLHKIISINVILFIYLGNLAVY